jgi:hypothetical protein
MPRFAVIAMHWLNEYRRNALDPLIRLYDEEATQDCNCGGPKVIAGTEALRAYWIEQFKTHSIRSIVGLHPEDDGESLSFLTSKGVVRARLHIDERGKILRVECGLVQ